MNLLSSTRQFIVHRNGQPVVYDVQNAQIVLRRERGGWVKYLVGTLPGGIRFEGSYGPASAVDVRRWERSRGITPTGRCAARALHALVDRLVEMVGIGPVLQLCAQAVNIACA